MFALELLGIALMWLVILLRVPLVLYHRDPLLHWGSIALIAVTLTLYIGSVNRVLSQLLGPYIVYLGIHLITLANSTVVLCFVLTISQRLRYIRPVLGIAAGTAIVIVAIYVSVDPVDPRPGRALDLPLAYWLLISGFRIVTLVCCTALCWYGCVRADHSAMRGGLIVFGLGLLVTAIPPAMNFGWLYTQDAVWKDYFPAIDGIAALCVTVGSSLPLTPVVKRSVADFLAYLRLRPLWHVLAGDAANGMGRMPSFVPVDLRLYWVTTEIRDAMLLLRQYVGTDTLDRARAYVAKKGVPDSLADATTTACCLAAAQWHKAQGKRPEESVRDLPDQSRHHMESEVAFLSQVADAYFSEVVRECLIRLSANEARC